MDTNSYEVPAEITGRFINVLIGDETKEDFLKAAWADEHKEMLQSESTSALLQRAIYNDSGIEVVYDLASKLTTHLENLLSNAKTIKDAQQKFINDYIHLAEVLDEDNSDLIEIIMEKEVG